MKITKAMLEAEAKRVFGQRVVVDVDWKHDDVFESRVNVPGAVLFAFGSRMKARRALYELMRGLQPREAVKS